LKLINSQRFDVLLTDLHMPGAGEGVTVVSAMRHVSPQVYARGFRMTSRPARLLCVGEDLKLLQTRCAVLEHSGYRAQSAMLPEVEDLLRSQEFDLLIVSAWLSEQETAKILTTAGKTPALVLNELTLADKLLAEVERLLEA
jgi:hypothetical protein